MRDVCVSFEENGQGRCRRASTTHLKPTECSSAPQSSAFIPLHSSIPNSHLAHPAAFLPFISRLLVVLQGPFFLLERLKRLDSPISHGVSN
ncbi:hypothetical protein QQG55_41490 [Brugia pahangi]